MYRHSTSRPRSPAKPAPSNDRNERQTKTLQISRGCNTAFVLDRCSVSTYGCTGGYDLDQCLQFWLLDCAQSFDQHPHALAPPWLPAPNTTIAPSRTLEASGWPACIISYLGRRIAGFRQFCFQLKSRARAWLARGLRMGFFSVSPAGVGCSIFLSVCLSVSLPLCLPVCLCFFSYSSGFQTRFGSHRLIMRSARKSAASLMLRSSLADVKNQAAKFSSSTSLSRSFS